MFSLLNFSVARQGAKVKMMVTRKQMQQHFLKTNISYCLIPARQWKRNINFREILHTLLSCNSFEIRPFSFWPTNCILAKCPKLPLNTWKTLELVNKIWWPSWYRNQSFNLHCKLIDWFLCDMSFHWNVFTNRL